MATKSNYRKINWPEVVTSSKSGPKLYKLKNGFADAGAQTPLDLRRLHQAVAVILPGAPDPVHLEVEDEGKNFFSDHGASSWYTKLDGGVMSGDL